MKLAFVNEYYKPVIGGVNQVVEELSKLYLKNGHEVHVYCSDYDKEKRISRKEEIIEGIHVHRCFHWFKAGNFVTFFPSVFFKLLRKDFDVIHSHESGHPHVFFSALASFLKGIPHIHTTHCPWTDSFRSFFANLMKWPTYNIFMRLSYAMSKAVVAITPWELPTLEKYASISKIKVIPNGMSSIFFNKIKNNDFKKKIKAKKNLILFFGRLNITKGPDKFVLAAKEILKERKDVTFVIRGPDEGMKSSVKSLIGAEKNIILMEPTRDKHEIAKMYQSASVFVLPSYREGLPLTIFEAMASGLPIVASPVNGVPFEMKHNENGLFVSYGNIQGLKTSILRLLKDKKLTNRMKINNIKKAKNYEWNHIYRCYLTLYNKFLGD